MIQSIHKGRGFRGLLEYVLDPSKDPELVGGNLYGSDARSLAKELGSFRALRPGLEKVVFHSSLSLPHGPDGREALAPEAWRDVAERYLEHLGYGRSPFVVIRHRDTGHDHVHIVASRIDAEGRAVSDSHDYRRGEEILRRLERDFGLTPVISAHEVDRSAMKAAEVGRLERTGETSVRLRLQDLLDRATADGPTLGELVRRLEAAGVEVLPRIALTGHVSGLSFRLEGVAFRGSALGRAYSFRGLQDRLGVSYEPARDLPTLRAAAERVAGPVPAGRGSPAPTSAWSPRALEALQSELAGLRPRGGLRAELAQALGATSGRPSAPVEASRLVALRSPRTAFRHLARRVPTLRAVSPLLDAAVALRSPLGVGLYGARLAGRAGRSLLARERREPASSPVVRRVVAAYLRAASVDRPSRAVFFARLREAGVEPVPLQDGRGRVRALAYRLDGELVAGQDIGRSFTWQGVQERLGADHDPTTDVSRNRAGRQRGGPWRGDRAGPGARADDGPGPALDRDRDGAAPAGPRGPHRDRGPADPAREPGRRDSAEARGAGRAAGGPGEPRPAGPRAGGDAPGSERPPRRDLGPPPRPPRVDGRSADLAPRGAPTCGASARGEVDGRARGGRSGGPGADPGRAVEWTPGSTAREDRLAAATLRSALERTGTPSLADFRAATAHRDLPRIDAAWARRALRAGVAPHFVLREVAERGARDGASPEARLAYATRTLGKALAAVRPEKPVSQVVTLVAQALAITVKLPLALVKALLVVRSVARELAQDRGRG